MQQVSRYNLANGFPVIPDRSIKGFWNRPIGELCAFINGVTTLDGLREFGCTWWDEWASPEKTALFGLKPGDIGPASYGGAFHDFPTLDGGRFNQFANLVRQIKELPGDRVHMITPWMPKENARGVGLLQSNTIAPCHGWVHVRILNNRIHLHLYQRSGDTPVGVPSNMIQYAALMLMLEQLTGYEPATFYHTISDAHYYEDQLGPVEELTGRESLRLPTVQLTEAGRQVKVIHDFRREHFELTDYYPHPAIPGIKVST
jgi:thymidylate synthase